MPKGRMLNKKISKDIEVAQLSCKAALLYSWCIPHLDVEGRIEASSEVIKGVVMPYRKDFTLSVIKHCIEEIARVDGLIIYYGNNYKYMQFLGFTKNQKLNKDREAPSEIPSPTPEELRSKSGLSLSKVKLSKDKGQGATFSFEELYLKYPKRVGKKDAARHFEASVKTEQDWQDIQIALKNYLESERVAKGYIQNASTWFNNWRDWVNFKETLCPKCKGKGKFTSTTGYEIVCDCQKGKHE